MELGLGLVDAVTGARADVVVHAATGTRLAAVSDALRARVVSAGATGRLLVAGAPVPEQTLLGSWPLVHGAVVEVAARAAPPPAAAAAAPAPAPGWCLRVVGGPDAGATHELPEAGLVIGRDPTCDLVLHDDDLSRRHCRVMPAPRGAFVRDLGSTNGTALDGRLVATEDAELPAHALLRVGSSTLALTPPEPAPVPTTPTGDGGLAHARPPRVQTAPTRPRLVVPFPPEAVERARLPWLSVLAPLVLGVAMWRITGSLVFLLLTLLSPLLVVGQVVGDRRSGRRRRRGEAAAYRTERAAAEQALARAIADDERVRRERWPDPAAVLLTAAGPGPRLWERRRDDADALALRLGLAHQPADLDVDGDLADLSTTAHNCPVVVPLAEVGVLGIRGPTARGLARALVVQAAALHSPRDLRVVVVSAAAGDASEGWDWVRWLPHSRADGRHDCAVLLGLGAAQAGRRVAELCATVDERARDPAGSPAGSPAGPSVLLVVDGAAALRSVPGLARLLADGPAHGVQAICLESGVALPPECRAVAEPCVGAGPARLRVHARNSEPLDAVLPDQLSRARAERAARALAPLRDASRERGSEHGLPQAVRWTELVGLPLTGEPRDAGLLVERWQKSPRSTLVPLGRRADGALVVDLAADGPHALVAGTTGSGKSELLQTLLASLALANRPDELQLVLVDYKGGAAFGPCAGFPHTVGLVTDLDGPLVERALHSLGAELSRRERLLAAAGAKDLEAHRRVVSRTGDAVLPRLVLVVDEFAALVEDVPDFVTGLVDIAMRGRSLGVHLVLATQRPQGRVSADIRANTALRLCLAVTSDEESRDVLDSPVAAGIARATPGRGYLRTGPSSLVAFQAARVGGLHRPVGGPPAARRRTGDRGRRDRP